MDYSSLSQARPNREKDSMSSSKQEYKDIRLFRWFRHVRSGGIRTE
jgi:hypothetical protein